MVDTSLLEKILLLENDCGNKNKTPKCVSVLFINNTSGNNMDNSNATITREGNSKKEINCKSFCKINEDRLVDRQENELDTNSIDLSDSSSAIKTKSDQSILHNRDDSFCISKSKSDNSMKSNSNSGSNKNFYYFHTNINCKNRNKKINSDKEEDSLFRRMYHKNDISDLTGHSLDFTQRNNCEMRQPNTNMLNGSLHKKTNTIKGTSDNSWASGIEDESGHEAYHHTTIIKHVKGDKSVKNTHTSDCLYEEGLNSANFDDENEDKAVEITYDNSCLQKWNSSEKVEAQRPLRGGRVLINSSCSNNGCVEREYKTDDNIKSQTNTGTKSYVNKPDTDLFTYGTLSTITTRERYLHCLVNKNNLKNNKEQVADNRKKINVLSNRLKKSFEALYMKKKQFDILKKKLHVLNNFSPAMDIDDFYFQRGEYTFRDYVWKPSLIFKTLINIPPLKHKYTQTKRNGIIDFEKRKKTQILDRERRFVHQKNGSAANSKLCIYRDRTELSNNKGIEQSKYIMSSSENELGTCFHRKCKDKGIKRTGIELYRDGCPVNNDLGLRDKPDNCQCERTIRTESYLQTHLTDSNRRTRFIQPKNNSTYDCRNNDTKRTGVNIFLNNTVSRRMGSNHCKDIGTGGLKFDKLYTKYIDRFSLSKEKGNTTFRCISIYHNENRLDGPFIQEEDANSLCNKFISVLYVDKNDPLWGRRKNRVIYEEEIIEDIVIHIIEDESYIYEKKCGKNGATKYKLFYRENKDWCLLEDGA